MPSSAARLRASAAEEPDCQVLLVSTSSHQTYEAGLTSIRAAAADGTKNDVTLYWARSWPYSQEQAVVLPPVHAPYGVAPVVGQVVTRLRTSPGLAVLR